MLGAIADDLTGATDLATMLRRSGHRTAVVIGLDGVDAADAGPEALDDADAVVVALKSRTVPPAEAVATSLAALRLLRGRGARQVYVKYCSTFDSTDEGNIGPVLDAVGDALGARRVVVVPSLPANGRTVEDGLLRVHGTLLEDSPMRLHPLTPMTRSRVADLLRPQTSSSVAEVGLPAVRRGPDVLRRALDDADGRHVVVDAVTDDDLARIGAAVADDVLVSGGSGLALGLPGPHRDAGSWAAPAAGARVVLCGSVSAATRSQVAVAARTASVRRVDLRRAVADVDGEVAALAAWVAAAPSDADPPVVCAARDAGDVVPVVDGTPTAPVVEEVLARLALRLVEDHGVRALVVAGGETSGAVVRRLGVPLLHIGPEVAPGVCWSAGTTAAGHPVALALKSGGFGGEDLLVQAWDGLS